MSVLLVVFLVSVFLFSVLFMFLFVMYTVSCPGWTDTPHGDSAYFFVSPAKLRLSLSAVHSLWSFVFVLFACFLLVLVVSVFSSPHLRQLIRFAISFVVQM